MTLRRNVAINVNKYRTAQGLTLKELAEASGVSRGYLGQIERGQVNSTVDVLEKVANALGVDVFDLASE